MTPADLAELLKTTAAAVLAEHDLDASALPATVTVERPRNPEHGDYATNLALQLAKKVGANPRELAGWLGDGTDRRRRYRLGRSGRARVRQPSDRRQRPGRHRQQRHRRGKELRTLRRPGRPERQPRVRLRQPDRADPHRRHPLGGRRRRTRAAAVYAGRPGRPGVLLQRPRRPDRPVHQLVDRRRKGRTDPRRRICGRLHQGHRSAGAGQGTRRAEPAAPTRCTKHSARSAWT